MAVITEFLFFYCLLAVVLAQTVVVAVATTRAVIAVISLYGISCSTAFAQTTPVAVNKQVHSTKTGAREISDSLFFCLGFELIMCFCWSIPCIDLEISPLRS